MSMTDKKTYKSEFDAWKWVHEMFPNKQWYLDHESSERAGYKTYRDTEEFYNYVCELGDRLEVNLKEGNHTINLWIESDSPEAVDEDANANERAGSEKVYNLPFNDGEAIVLKAALTQMCSSFNNIDITTGQYSNTDAAMICLTLVSKIKEVM